MMNDDIVLLLDESMSSAIGGIAQDLCGKSAMAPITGPFPYFRLFETPASPHGAAAQQLHAAAATACQERYASPLTGRLLRWAIEYAELRLLVEVSEPSFQDLEHRLQARLPSGRPCRAGHIAVGSIEQIDPAVHSAFLAAVEDAYPIVVDRATFIMTKAVVRAASASAASNDMMPHIELKNAPNKPQDVKPAHLNNNNNTSTASKAKAPPKVIELGATPARPAPKAAKAQPMDLDSLIRSQSNIQKKKNQKKKKTKNVQQQQLAGASAPVARAPQPSPWQYKKPMGPVREKGWNRLVRVVKP